MERTRDAIFAALGAPGAQGARVFDYLSKPIVKLPDFFATRTTARYDDPPKKDERAWKTVTSDQSLHPTATSRTTVTYRDGKDVVDAKAKNVKRLNADERELETRGTFGPILAVVFAGASSPRSMYKWSHWEQGIAGPEAFFRYAVPKGGLISTCGVAASRNPMERFSPSKMRLTMERLRSPTTTMLQRTLNMRGGRLTIGLDLGDRLRAFIVCWMRPTVLLHRLWVNGDVPGDCVIAMAQRPLPDRGEGRTNRRQYRFNREHPTCIERLKRSTQSEVLPRECSFAVSLLL
jgi:hypothetical protein